MTNCQQPSESLSDFVDGLLDPAERAALASHLQSCEACSGLVDDLTRLKDAARSLGPIEPPAHVWQNIQASLPSGRRQTRTQWMGLAAALVLITAGAYFFARFTAPAPRTDVIHSTASNANGPATVETVEQELAQAAQHYENAIAQLEAVVKQDNNALPADTAAKLQVSLTQVDKGIAASRAALMTEPQNDPARDSLFAALRQKVEILQQTVALMGVMQRGDGNMTARGLDGKKG
jgi:anti-sigma factor RsiW